jgi:hypothetical protein
MTRGVWVLLATSALFAAVVVLTATKVRDGPQRQTPVVRTTLPAPFGDFRLIPYGYAGSLPHTEELPANPGGQTVMSTFDEAKVRTSLLYKEPKNIPPGYRLAHAEGNGTDSVNLRVVLVYEGASFPIVIARQAIVQKPIDVFLFAPTKGAEKNSIVVTGLIGNTRAVFTKTEAGRGFQGPLIIQFAEAGILTSLEWRVTNVGNAESEFQQLLRVAESLVTSGSPNTTPTTGPSRTASPVPTPP